MDNDSTDINSNYARSLIADGQLESAKAVLTEVRNQRGETPEWLRTQALLQSCMGDDRGAIASLERALQLEPDSAASLNDLANAIAFAGRGSIARDIWSRVNELEPAACRVWGTSELGRDHEYPSSAGYRVDLLQRWLAARVILGNEFVRLGRVDDASIEYRAAIAIRPTFGDAWWSLANIKTVPLTSQDRTWLSLLLANQDIEARDRTPMEFALATACEACGDTAQAFHLFNIANSRVRKTMTWSATAFDGHVRKTVAAFDRIRPSQLRRSVGNEVIFLVSLPRAGSTLVEQILASHPEVDAVSELSYLGQVIRDETMRRQQAFPQWVSNADAADWDRLGHDYLHRAANVRSGKSRFTDKMPDNWFYVGAICAMLPGARIINCRRDPVETCWSCFKQYFYGGQEYTYNINDLAAYWKAYDHACRSWKSMYPTQIMDFAHEDLLADPETCIRDLLAFCNLPFDPACLRPHEAKRRIRTASAAQVREPIRKSTARTDSYGSLLDDLKAALA